MAAGTARLQIREIGAGPSIVVLHGGPDFGYDYLLPELDRLAERFRLVYYDQRGRGRSADGVRPEDVTIESERDDLDLLRRHLGLESMAVLGHSWGGLMAMEYASRHPERLTHLILMNTAPGSYEDRELFRQHLRRIRPAGDVEAMESLAASAAFRAGDLEVEAEYYRIHYRVALRDPGLLDQLVPRLRLTSTPEEVLTARAIEDRLYEQTWSSPGYDLLPKLRRLEVPTLVIHGEDDFVPVEVAAHCRGDSRGNARSVAAVRPLLLPGGTRRRYAARQRAVRGRIGGSPRLSVHFEPVCCGADIWAQTAHSLAELRRCRLRRADLVSFGRRSTGLAEPQVQRRSDEKVQQSRCDQAAEDHHRQRVLDLMTGTFAEHHQWNQGQCGGERGHQDRREALASCPDHQVLAERLTLLPFEVLGVVDQQDAVAGSDAEHGEETDQRAERDHPTADECGEDPAHQGHRQGQEDQQRGTLAAERGLQQ